MSTTALQAGGRWPVVLSGGAITELRKLERDQKALEVVHKKIRELSMGHFSRNNCRPIIGTLQYIPMFRAKVSLDLRIIYQIDVLPDSAGIYDHQAIKIFQIESRVRVDYQFWAKVSVRLQRTNPSYQERCQRLPRVETVDGERQFPVMFPHEDYGLGVSREESGFLLDGLTEVEQEQIQGITMDRFAPFNKALYNCITADLEMVLPMILDEHERAIVNHKGASIIVGRSGTGKTTALIYKIRAVDQANATNEEHQPIRQMFVTRSRVLAQHVEATYRGLAEFTNIALKSEEELKEMAKQFREDPERALVEFDTEVDLRNDLPSRYSELTESHFPLFISFDKLCLLLEGDIYPGEISPESVYSFVGYDNFLHNYWPAFRGSTRGLEPNLVWSEIIGVIKGSQAAFNSKEGYLSREEYVEGLSQRQFSLLASVRAQVYSVFELYNKRKMARYGTDAADRARIILHHLPKILQGPAIDYLYVDEVQDNLMIDIYLLRKLAKSIEGIYWSGDSAQTIIAGSSFRINDLKAFTYQEQGVPSSPRATRKSITSPQFTMFDLNVNFRSLSGIVRFSRSLVEAIHKFFPQTIDPMEPERAKQYGDPPILFTNIQNEAGYLENFLIGSNASNRVVFGAQQAILVRDAATAEELDDRLQGLCSVLSIMDSKGLEFDDVLIYNFFSTSPAPTTVWGYLSGDTRLKQPPPPVLCSELKLLYVAATRARRRCWIWDSGQLIDKLSVMWISHGLVSTEPASRMIGRLAASSNKAQWSSKGREYFSHRLYKLAAACFRQAEQINNFKLSTAYHLMSRAKLKRLRGDTPTSREELAAAAAELVSCAELPGIGDSKNVYFHAATCFRDAQMLLPAASAFVKAGQATQGITMLFGAHDYKNAANLLAENREIIGIDVFEELRDQVRVYFFERREYGRLALVFDTVGEKITYARERKYRTQLKYMLAELQRYDELAEEYVAEGNLTNAVAYCIKAYEDYQTRTSIVRAVEVVIGYTQSVLLVEGTYRKNDQDLAKSLVKTIRPFVNLAGRDSRTKIDLFYTYLWFDYVSIHMVQAWDRANPTHQYIRTLASYLLIKRNSRPRNDPPEALLEYLDILKSYKADIIRIIKADRPCTLPLAQKLLGFTPIKFPPSSVTFTVFPGSLINRTTPQVVARNDTWSGNDIDAVLREELPKRLDSLVASWHSAALALTHTQPSRFESTPYAHSPSQFPQVVAEPIGACAAKLHIISKVLEILDVKENVRYQTDYTVSGYLWLERIFGIIHLASGELGSIHSLRTVADFEAISGCLRNWLMRSWAGLFHSGYSADSITHMLLHFLVQSSFQGELSEPNNTQTFPIDIIPAHNLKTAVVQPLHALFSTQSSNQLKKAVRALRHLLNPNIQPDTIVMIHFLELLTRKIIICMNPEGQQTFDGLLLPLSWTRVLARKYKNVTYENVTDGWIVECFNSLCSVIKRISNELRFGTPGRSKQISPAMVDLLNLRLCWCIALAIAHMDRSDVNLPPALETLRTISSFQFTPTPYYSSHGISANRLYHAFSRVKNQRAALVALGRTFQHESLVLVLKDSDHQHPAKFMGKVRRIVYTDPTELIERLDQLALLPNPGPSSSDDEFPESGEDYPLPAQPIPPNPPNQTPQIQQIQPQEQTAAQGYGLQLIFFSFLFYYFFLSGI